jgi:hypothetical protein
MTYQKIGFLTGVGGNARGIGDYVNELDAAGRPATCMSNDDIGGVDDILKRWEAGSTVDHVTAFRVVRDGPLTM